MLFSVPVSHLWCLLFEFTIPAHYWQKSIGNSAIPPNNFSKSQSSNPTEIAEHQCSRKDASRLPRQSLRKPQNLYTRLSKPLLWEKPPAMWEVQLLRNQDTCTHPGQPHKLPHRKSASPCLVLLPQLRSRYESKGGTWDIWDMADATWRRAKHSSWGSSQTTPYFQPVELFELRLQTAWADDLLLCLNSCMTELWAMTRYNVTQSFKVVYKGQ